jgi:diamine N-acetyltransferase
MSKTIEYIETDERALDAIGFLWEKLNEHHRVRSPHYAAHFASMTFDVRKKGLLEKSHEGVLRLDIAKNTKTGKLIGYCISTVITGKQGEIESLFVENEYRKCGIGDIFMNKAMKWMDSLTVTNRIIGVGVGNEEVFGFYARYNFYPRVTILSQPNE